MYKDLVKNIDEWVSVKECSIPKDLIVLLFCCDQITVGFFDSKREEVIFKKGCTEWDYNWQEVEPTHWMFLPLPPGK